MSIPVDLDDLAGTIATFGPAYLLTVGAELTPRVRAVKPEPRGGSLVVSVGERTAAGLAERPKVTLLWPALSEGGYALIVDGTGVVGADGDVAVTPGWAVLHQT